MITLILFSLQLACAPSTGAEADEAEEVHWTPYKLERLALARWDKIERIIRWQHSERYVRMMRVEGTFSWLNGKIGKVLSFETASRSCTVNFGNLPIEGKIRNLTLTDVSSNLFDLIDPRDVPVFIFRTLPD